MLHLLKLHKGKIQYVYIWIKACFWYIWLLRRVLQELLKCDYSPDWFVRSSFERISECQDSDQPRLWSPLILLETDSKAQGTSTVVLQVSLTRPCAIFHRNPKNTTRTTINPVLRLSQQHFEVCVGFSSTPAVADTDYTLCSCLCCKPTVSMLWAGLYRWKRSTLRFTIWKGLMLGAM